MEEAQIFIDLQQRLIDSQQRLIDTLEVRRDQLKWISLGSAVGILILFVTWTFMYFRGSPVFLWGTNLETLRSGDVEGYWRAKVASWIMTCGAFCALAPLVIVSQFPMLSRAEFGVNPPTFFSVAVVGIWIVTFFASLWRLSRLAEQVYLGWDDARQTGFGKKIEASFHSRRDFLLNSRYFAGSRGQSN